MKITEKGIFLDAWDLRAFVELGSGSFSPQRIEEKRKSMTMSLLHRLYYRLKYPTIRFSPKEEK